MEFATGALGTLLPKLAQLLQSEYKLHKNVRKNIEFLKKELEITQAALRSVGEVPTEQLTELVRIWAREARELSYNMEDIIDTFLVRVEGPNPPSKRSSKRFIQKMKSMLAVGKRHQIGEQIKDIKERVEELVARRDRYKIDNVNHVTSVDPRIKALYVKTTELVGIDKARKEIIIKLTKEDDMSPQQKIISIFGFGGLGKTTLAKAVYDELKLKLKDTDELKLKNTDEGELKFECTAFVTVSQNPDMEKILKNMLYKLDQLDQRKYENIHSTSLDVIIDLIREFIGNKRCFIVIDDIWDISNWDIIKCAMPDDNNELKILTTTRNVTVAKYIGGAYEMKHLSLDSSRVLLCRRIFGNEDTTKCLDEELSAVSNKILKKCAGVPLAIITMASLLAIKGRNKTEWDEVYNSIGSGMENNLDAENMRKILSYSYYDLPSHLKTCLLYFSMFPEDFEIRKVRLIRLWIAEGFIQHKKQGRSLFELGESYFNELINRSMIQPMINYHNEIWSCQVHDTVLDLLRYLSNVENFVTGYSDMDQISTSTTVRRLSFQHGKIDHGSIKDTRSMTQVRSVIVFSSDGNQIPTLPCFEVLRVLDLQGCVLLRDYNIKYLGNLVHLRYLSLVNTFIQELPEEVGDLQFLETLDVCNNAISCLPSTITRLNHLMFLSIDRDARFPNMIGNLKSLEELLCLRIDEDSKDNVEVLGLLTELRVLGLSLFTNKWNNKLVELLSKLQKIQYLYIFVQGFYHKHRMDGLNVWVASRHLRVLAIRDWCWFPTLPAGMNRLLDLSYLSIAVSEVRQEDLLILGRLPSLSFLHLDVDHVDLGIYEIFVIGAGSFPCLLSCTLMGFAAPVVFQQGAMPRLKALGFEYPPRGAKEIAGSDGCFDFTPDCLANLPSLQNVDLWFPSRGVSEKERDEAVAAVKEEAEIHPNHSTPIFRT